MLLPQCQWFFHIIRFIYFGSNEENLITCFLQILLALHSVQYRRGDDKSVWKVICKSEYRRCAVVECYQSVKHVIRKILKEGSEEYEIFLAIFEEIDGATIQGRFTSTFFLPELMNIHSRVVDLISILLTRPNKKEIQKVG